MPAARLSLVALALLTFAGGCRSDDAAPEPAAGAVLPAEALQERFPEAVRNLARINVGGEVEGALGFEVSRASALYGAEVGAGEPYVVLAVLDMGSAEMADNMGYGWGLREAVPEAPAGASTMQAALFDAHPARRTPAAETGERRLQVVVGRRFLVEASGRQVDPEVLDEAVRSLDLADLVEVAESGA